MGKAVNEQDHGLLLIFSRSFTGHSSNGGIVEKDAFSLVESMTRLNYFTISSEAELFTDHSNLIRIFDLYGKKPIVS